MIDLSHFITGPTRDGAPVDAPPNRLRHFIVCPTAGAGQVLVPEDLLALPGDIVRVIDAAGREVWAKLVEVVTYDATPDGADLWAFSVKPPKSGAR
jgi:hypothetical protein